MPLVLEHSRQFIAHIVSENDVDGAKLSSSTSALSRHASSRNPSCDNIAIFSEELSPGDILSLPDSSELPHAAFTLPDEITQK